MSSTFILAIPCVLFIALPLSLIALISLCRIAKLADEERAYWEELGKDNRRCTVCGLPNKMDCDGCDISLN